MLQTNNCGLGLFLCSTEQLFDKAGVTPPEFFNSMKNNKGTTCMGAWFIGNTIVQVCATYQPFGYITSGIIQGTFGFIKGTFGFSQ
jgi:hypothetical protein